MNKLGGMRIIFFVPESNVQTNAVHASQVGSLAKYVAELGAECLIFQAATTLTERTYDILPNVHVLNDLLPRKKVRFFAVGRLYKRLAMIYRDELTAFKPTHIYTRNHNTCIGAMELAEITGAKLIYSMRGADVAEVLMKVNLKSLLIALNTVLQVRGAINSSDHINAVSQRMADWIYRKFHRKSSVLPCCVAEDAVVDATCLEEHKVKTVVYSGGLSAWQSIDSIIELMKKMSEVDAGIRFLFLTRDIELLESKCSQHDFSNERWEAKSCSPNEVVEELVTADCGIILRDNTMVNRVASPIKIGEYLAAGLGIIVSPHIGDVGTNLVGKEFACLVNEGTNVKDIVEFVHGLTVVKRASARRWAQDHLTYDANRAAVLEMFS